MSDTRMIVTVEVVKDGEVIFRNKAEAARAHDRIAQAETLAGSAAHLSVPGEVRMDSGAVIAP